jgi:hypothetical protein
MNLYSYVVRVDGGVAPNPQGKYCTLACCKPTIRRTAEVGDWIVGCGSKETVGQDMFVYAMKVKEVLTFEDYHQDKRFKGRIDNIYYKEEKKWVQSANNFHGKSDMKRDLSGRNVLISDEFFYLGEKSIPFPAEILSISKRGRNHKKLTDNTEDEKKLINLFVRWVEKGVKRGKSGKPFHSNDKCDS